MGFTSRPHSSAISVRGGRAAPAGGDPDPLTSHSGPPAPAATDGLSVGPQNGVARVSVSLHDALEAHQRRGRSVLGPPCSGRRPPLCLSFTAAEPACGLKRVSSPRTTTIPVGRTPRLSPSSAQGPARGEHPPHLPTHRACCVCLWSTALQGAGRAGRGRPGSCPLRGLWGARGTRPRPRGPAAARDKAG